MILVVFWVIDNILSACGMFSLDVSIPLPGEQQPVPPTQATTPPQEASAGQLPLSVYHVWCTVITILVTNMYNYTNCHEYCDSQLAPE